MKQTIPIKDRSMLYTDTKRQNLLLQSILHQFQIDPLENYKY